MGKYNEIKNNFVNNFFDKIFTHSTVSVKNHIFEKMKEYCPFTITPLNDCAMARIDLGDDIVLTFNLEWNERETSNGHIYTLNRVYYDN